MILVLISIMSQPQYTLTDVPFNNCRQHETHLYLIHGQPRSIQLSPLIAKLFF